MDGDFTELELKNELDKFSEKLDSDSKEKFNKNREQFEKILVNARKPKVTLVKYYPLGKNFYSDSF